MHHYMEYTVMAKETSSLMHGMCAVVNAGQRSSAALQAVKRLKIATLVRGHQFSTPVCGCGYLDFVITVRPPSRSA